MVDWHEIVRRDAATAAWQAAAKQATTRLRLGAIAGVAAEYVSCVPVCVEEPDLCRGSEQETLRGRT
jgi:hypothetical protein